MWGTAVQVSCAVILLWPVLLTLDTAHAQAVYSECGGTISSREFRLTSPPWLAQTAGDTCCEYCVVAASPAVCNLEVTFRNFLLPASTDGSCSTDSLTIGEQKFCGGIAGVKLFPFNQENMRIKFQSSGSENGKGFDLLIRQQECAAGGYETQRQSVCGGEFYGSDVTISSPGYPNGYDNYLDCVYTVRLPNGGTCEVDVSFDTTVIEYSDNCFKDKLVIENDVLCGRLVGSRKYRVKNKLTIRFVSDSYASELGFRLTVKTTRCLDRDSVQVFTDSPGRQSVGGYNYPQPTEPFPIPNPQPTEPFPIPNPQPSGPYPSDPNSNLFPPGNYYPEPSGRPPNELPSYPNNYQPVNGRPCVPYFGNNKNTFNTQPCYPNVNNLPNYVQPNYLYPLPTYPNRQQNYPPVTYDGDQQQCCGRIYNAQHFLIVSPGFPKSRAVNCLYTIQPFSSNVCMLRFQFRYFWVGEEDGNSGCPGEFLNIDGRAFCGCKTGLVWMSPFVEGTTKILNLRTNGASDKPFSGFVIEVYQDECQAIRWKRNANNSSENAIDSNDVKGQDKNNTPTEETTELLSENSTPQWESDENNTSLEIRGLEVNQSKIVSPATKSGIGSINRIFDTSNMRPNSQFAWDPLRQLWYLPRTAQCIRWGLNDWLLLIRESLWSQYQCPVSTTTTNTQFNPYQGGRQYYQLQTQNC